jgi:hypothetical protein
VPSTLSRKGLLTFATGEVPWSALNTNATLIDANAAWVSDLLQTVTGINGVVSGFTLGTGSGLVPSLTGGTLIAQGQPLVSAGAVTLTPAPASMTSYLFYTTILGAGFYYATSLAPHNAGDAFIGIVVAGASTITSVTQATKIYGLVDVPSTAAPGPFSVPHLLGRTPVGVGAPLMTAAGVIFFQTPTLYDGLNLYLTASDAGLTAKLQIF